MREIVDPWEADFIGRYDIEGKLELLKAVNYLEIPAIFELCCAAVAVEFRGKSFDQVKKDFNLEGVTYTPEDDDRLIKNYPWILDETHKKTQQLLGAAPIKK